MFKHDLCDLCGDCLVECQWMDVSRDEAVEWIKALMEGQRAPVLDKCITCYACNEVCPKDASPFDLIAELQERYHTPIPEEFVASNEARYLFSGKLSGLPQADRIMSICVFGKTDANLIEGELFDLPQIGGKPYFCWILFSHMCGESVQRKHAKTFVERLAQTGAKEIVCFHDDCYSMLKYYAPEYGIDVPFRPIHLTEYIVEYLHSNKNRVKKLNIDIAYQRPCASRHTPGKERFIDELFDLVGVRRVERQYDREHALCCAGTKLLLGQGDPGPDQKKNMLDAKNSGARAVVCLCPMCMRTLSGAAGELDLPLLFIGDIARMALCEIKPPALQ